MEKLGSHQRVSARVCSCAAVLALKQLANKSCDNFQKEKSVFKGLSAEMRLLLPIFSFESRHGSKHPILSIHPQTLLHVPAPPPPPLLAPCPWARSFYWRFSPVCSINCSSVQGQRRLCNSNYLCARAKKIKNKKSKLKSQEPRRRVQRLTVQSHTHTPLY